MTDGHAVGIGGVKQRTLLSLLLVDSGRLISKEQLFEEIWYGNPPEHADNALHALVARLRKTLDSLLGEGFSNERLATGRPGYGLHLDGIDSDARLFTALTEDARRRLTTEPEQALRLLVEALALWRGPALDGVRTGNHLRGVAARLNEQRLAAHEEKLELQALLRPCSSTVSELQQLAMAHPLHEGLSRRLMIALYRSGRQAEALGVYSRVRTLLHNELGLDPSPESQQCLQAILRHDVSLVPRPAGALATG
ncbi:BTAD domain-containing putative transcriptional regulator [Streptomyces sp. NPDC058398]|uniref:AfsR/SARP family transcriptional regulator n=1 Tax=Streptomyces sp. NPDC058398 TaxID=3346479 RepID=UPI003659DCE6